MCRCLPAFSVQRGIPMVETIAGKGAVTQDHAALAGPSGTVGPTSANALAAGADVILAIGTRLQDFTTGSWTAFRQDANSSRSTRPDLMPPGSGGWRCSRRFGNRDRTERGFGRLASRRCVDAPRDGAVQDAERSRALRITQQDRGNCAKTTHSRGDPSEVGTMKFSAHRPHETGAPKNAPSASIATI